MFKRMMLVVTVALVAAFSVWGLAFAQPPTTSTTTTEEPQQVAVPAPPPCTPLKQIYSHRNWRDGHPLRGENPCPLSASQTGKLKLEFHTYRSYRKIAHVPGFHEGDPYLEWLPRIPRYVVACETRGYSGEGRWAAGPNSAGAVGPAQLLLGTWNPPWPIESNQDKLRYWKIVHGLWGNTSWDCA